MKIDNSGFWDALSGLYLALKSHPQWTGVRYLCYHSVISAAVPNGGDSYYTLTSRSFRQQMETLRLSGIKVISLPASLNILENNTIYNNRYVVITFDDGYVDNFDVAWPILEEYGYPAHFFIVSDRIGLTFKSGGKKQIDDNDKMCMNADMLRHLMKSGATIGSHSTDHRALTMLNEHELPRCVHQSRERLEQALGDSIDTFAYPFAAYNERAVKSLCDAGFRYAFSVGMGYKKVINDDNRFFIHRNIISGRTPLPAYQKIIRGGYDWLWPYQKMKHILNYKSKK